MLWERMPQPPSFDDFPGPKPVVRSFGRLGPWYPQLSCFSTTSKDLASHPLPWTAPDELPTVSTDEENSKSMLLPIPAWKYSQADRKIRKDAMTHRFPPTKGMHSAIHTTRLACNEPCEDQLDVRSGKAPGGKQALFAGVYDGHGPGSSSGVLTKCDLLWPQNLTPFDIVWAYGPNWPYDGELDILEGADRAYTNIISGHTADGCVQDSSQDGVFSGTKRDTECAVGGENIGCGFDPPASDTSSYGDGFNAVGGGVYAMEWTSEHIRVWHFARGSVPADIKAKQPDPDQWGLPQAIFGGSSCNVDSYWRNMKLVINTNFCGDYGNALWEQDGCSANAPTCSEFVAQNPDAFANAYWDIRYIDAYQYQGNPGNKPDKPANGPTTTTTMTSSSVTIGGSEETLVHGPGTTGGPTNPIKIDDSSYLGCFGSSSGFETFNQVADQQDMSLELCIKLCKDKKFTGVFDSKCYCADSLDASTQAQSSEQQCNKPCPGSHDETCGGEAPAGTGSVAGPQPTGKGAQPGRSGFLLTVYGAVLDEPVPVPPPMATGLNLTTVTYTTVCPSAPHRLIQQEYVATVTVLQCGCEEDHTREWVPMQTTVVPCNGCGPGGESSITLTVPSVHRHKTATWTPVTSAAAWIPANVTTKTKPAVVMSEASGGWAFVRTSVGLWLALMDFVMLL